MASARQQQLHPLEKKMFTCLRKPFGTNPANLQSIVNEIIAAQQSEVKPTPNLNAKRPANFFYRKLLKDPTASYTALEYTIIKRLPRSAKVLIESKVDINTKTTFENEFTPLQLSIRNNSPEIFEALLLAGADLKFTDKNGHDAYVYAATACSTEFVRILLQHGMSVNHRIQQDLKSEDKKEADTNTLLMTAARFNCDDIVAFLIQQGADQNFEIGYQRTAITLAWEEHAFAAFLLLKPDPKICEQIESKYFSPAFKRFEDFLLGKSDKPEAHYYLGLLACNKSEWSKAVKHLKKALHSDWQFPSQGYQYLVRSCAKAGLKADALKYYVEVIADFGDYHDFSGRHATKIAWHHLDRLTNEIGAESTDIQEAFARGFNRNPERKDFRIGRTEDYGPNTSLKIWELFSCALMHNQSLIELEIYFSRTYGPPEYLANILKLLDNALRKNKHLKKISFNHYDGHYTEIRNLMRDVLEDNFSLEVVTFVDWTYDQDDSIINTKLQRNRDLKILSWSRAVVAIQAARACNDRATQVIPLADMVAEFIEEKPPQHAPRLNLSKFWGSQFFTKLIVEEKSSNLKVDSENTESDTLEEKSVLILKPMQNGN